MLIEFRGSVIDSVAPGVDRYTDQALEIAETVLAEYGEHVVSAEVDRFQGLVLHFRGAEPVRGWHFITPLCGYDGAGPATTAQILEMFGFGVASGIIGRINRGGDTAYFSFVKEAALQ